MKKEERYYDTPIGRLPSVTTVIGILDKPAIRNWAIKVTVDYIKSNVNKLKKMKAGEELKLFQEACREHEKIRQEAADIGIEVHEDIRRYVTEGIKPKRHLDLFNKFLEWFKDIDKVIESEKMVWSRLGYAGTLDLIAQRNKDLIIVDFKTSNQIYVPEFLMQLAAYKNAYFEQTGNFVKGMGILRIDKSGKKIEYREWNDTKIYAKHLSMFRCLLGYFKLLKEVL